MQRNIWKNTELNITLSVEYSGIKTVSIIEGVTRYALRPFNIKRTNMYGASFVDDFGTTLLIINGQALLSKLVFLYAIPAGVSFTPPIPSMENLQGFTN